MKIFIILLLLPQMTQARTWYLKHQGPNQKKPRIVKVKAKSANLKRSGEIQCSLGKVSRSQKIVSRDLVCKNIKKNYFFATTTFCPEGRPGAATLHYSDRGVNSLTLICK